MACIALVFFSYIPFLYFVSIIKIEKNLIFLLLMSAILILTLFSFAGQMLHGKIQFYKSYIIALSLYMLFALYALASFMFIGERLNDLFTIRTLTLVNPIFVILAMLCTQNKKYFITILTLLSGIYFVFLLISFIKGDISLSSSHFQSIFMNMEGSFYQNINTYLGIFVICNLWLLPSNNKYISILPKILIPISISGMFLIGGRGAVIALMAVLFIYFFNRHLKFSFKISDVLKKLILIFVLIVFLIFYLSEITKILDVSITWQRLVMLTETGDPSERIFLFSKALELFSSNIKTMIFGAGINGYSYYMSWDIPSYPHNLVLELLAEYGILGTIFFTMPLLYVLNIRKKILGSMYGNSIDEKIIFLFFIFELLRFFVSGGLRSSWVFIFYMFFLLPSKVIVLDKNLTDSSLVHKEIHYGK